MITEPELAWAHRELLREFDLEERLLRIGYVQCPGAYARGCLALIPGSGAMLCQFCQGTIRLNVAGRAR